MQPSNEAALPPPPGVIMSIRAGLDAVATHITAILLPVLLDLWIWFGPRLGMDRIFAQSRADLIAFWQALSISASDIQAMLRWQESAVPTLDIFWLLRTLPIGVPSLLAGRTVAGSPLGPGSSLQVSAPALPLWIAALVFAGWIGGALYFRRISALAAAPGSGIPISIGRAVLQTVLLSVAWLAVAVSVAVPLSLVISLILQFSPVIAQVMILAASFVLMWLVVPLFFWPHGIFIKGQSALHSMFASLRMARFTLPTSSFFVLSLALLAIGFNFVWSAADTDSWMTLVGILGHAFITTSLLAASFIYYRDMNAWLETLIERLRAASAAARRA